MTWKTFPGCRTYEVSSAGEVRNGVTGRLLKPYLQGGYLAFSAHGSNGWRKSFRLHRAVLEAFEGPCPDGMVGSHLDGDILNCRLSNLAWETPAKNEARKLDHGTDSRGEKSSQARFTSVQVRTIIDLYANGATHEQLAILTGVGATTIRKIISGQSYAEPVPVSGLRRAATNARKSA